MTGPRHRIDRPVEGFYRTRLVKGGPWVAARIFRTCCCTIGGGDMNVIHDWTPDCDRFPRLRCEVAGRERDAAEAWPSLLGNPIPESEWRYLRDGAEWDRRFNPVSPHARPTEPIDLNRMPSLF